MSNSRSLIHIKFTRQLPQLAVLFHHNYSEQVCEHLHIIIRSLTLFQCWTHVIFSN